MHPAVHRAAGFGIQCVCVCMCGLTGLAALLFPSTRCSHNTCRVHIAPVQRVLLLLITIDFHPPLFLLLVSQVPHKPANFKEMYTVHCTWCAHPKVQRYCLWVCWCTTRRLHTHTQSRSAATGFAGGRRPLTSAVRRVRVNVSAVPERPDFHRSPPGVFPKAEHTQRETPTYTGFFEK